jgi:hypothetical protein
MGEVVCLAPCRPRPSGVRTESVKDPLRWKVAGRCTIDSTRGNEGEGSDGPTFGGVSVVVDS